MMQSRLALIEDAKDRAETRVAQLQAEMLARDRTDDERVAGQHSSRNQLLDGAYS